MSAHLAAVVDVLDLAKAPREPILPREPVVDVRAEGKRPWRES